MDSRKEEICSNLIYQSYQGKDSFWSSCLPGWDRWKVGGEKTTSALKFWGLGNLGCERRATGESPIHENSLPMQSGLTIESAKEECVWESGQGSWKAGSLAWPPLHVILHQHRQQQKVEGSNWGPGPVSSTSYDIGTIFCCLSTFTLPHRNAQMNAITYFVSWVGTPLICLSPLAAHTFRKLRMRFVF